MCLNLLCKDESRVGTLSWVHSAVGGDLARSTALEPLQDMGLVKENECKGYGKLNKTLTQMERSEVRFRRTKALGWNEMV